MKKTKKRMVLRFPAETVNEPITYRLIKDYDIQVNILNADVTHGKEGNLLVELRGESANLQAAEAYLAEMKVDMAPAFKTILFREEACIHCGACASVCFPGALHLREGRRTLKSSPEKCVACELCIRACPLGLLELNFGTS